MCDSLNVLILSCGTRNKIVQCFKKQLNNNGLVIAADCSELAPGLYDADKYFIVPKMTEKGYIDVILRICKENKIDAVFSLIDPELSLMAKHKNDFLDIGTVPVVSDYDVVEMCFDKHRFSDFLIQNGFNSIRSYLDKNLFLKDVEKGIINYPVFVKPVRGSASININRVVSSIEIDLLFERFDNLMIQEFMDGVEYGADVYIDLISGDVKTIFVKEKIKMRSGETDKSVSVKDESLFNLIKDFVSKSGLRGVIDIDIFKVDDKFYISEVNPRFGGGYPHAYECGVNIPEMIINNIRKKENENVIGEYEENIFMMKYNEIKIVSKKNN
ncbi:MAG: ATP-grasp domain-containing protein [Candidatus Muiribacteriota bacterium]